jgi:hypothetical protein
VRRAIAPALLAALAACATPPPQAVATPLGSVRADDPATAAWIATALERAAQRMQRLSPAVPEPQLEVWVVADPGAGAEGVLARAKRSAWSARWTLHVDADSGWAMVGHELFHARYHERLRGWPAALIEGLADCFGLPDDILGDCVHMDRLMALAREPVPFLAMEFRRLDGTVSVLIGALGSDLSAGPPPLELERIGALDEAELLGLDHPAALYAYAVGYAAARRWLGDAQAIALPNEAPGWSGLVPESADELAREAAAELTPARRQRWALARFAGDVVRVLRDDLLVAGSVDDVLAEVEFSLKVGDGPERILNGDADLRELLELLWPRIAGVHPAP